MAVVFFPSGLSRGFAFVEFLTLKDSVHVMDQLRVSSAILFVRACVCVYLHTDVYLFQVTNLF